MKTKTVLLTVLAGLSLLAGSARAYIIASDDFSQYADGNLNGDNGGIGWNAAWVGNTYGTPTVANGQAIINGTGTDASRQLAVPQVPGSVVWLRFTGQQFTDTPTDNSDYFWGGLDIYQGNKELGLIGKGYQGPYLWTLTTQNQVTTKSTLSPSIVYASITTTATNMIFDLWVNPTDPNNLAAVAPDAAETNAFDGTYWDTIFLRDGSGDASEWWQFANLALGTTLADVAVSPTPIITSQPVSVTGYPGQNFTFRLQAAGNQPLGYQWRTNNVKLVNGGNISGAGSNVLTITNATLANAANSYACIVTNSLGAATSSVVSLVISTVPAFSALIPAPNAVSVPGTNWISIQIEEGNLLNTNSIVVDLDGAPVAPLLISQDGNFLTTVSYQPVSPLGVTTHSVMVRMTDFNSVSYTNSWSFSTASPTLPVTLPGPFNVGGGGSVTIFSAGDGWVGTNYNGSSSRTLYTRFSMEFNNVNNGNLDFPSSLGGLYGGLEFFEGDSENLLVGASWGDEAWSLGAGAPDLELNPYTFIATNDWHTIVVRTDYSPNNNANVSVWLDPDFTQTEANQPNTPVELAMVNTFDNIRLRCGNGPASASFSNILMAASSAGVGFVAPAVPQFQGFVPGVNATFVSPATPISLKVIFGSYVIHSNTIALTVDGNPVQPTFVVTPNTITLNYQPPTAFVPGSGHSLTVNLTDANGTPYSTSWSFTVDSYPALPVSLTGPFTVSGGGSTIILDAQNESLGSQYGATSTNVLYTRFSMEFTDVNNGGSSTPNSGGGCYGGLQFWQGGNQKLLVGDGWADVNWSLGANVPNEDLSPVTPIVAGTWHTLVVKSVYVSGGNTAVKVWLDPDFTKSEGNQPNPPVVLSVDNTFDNIMLRCGNGTATAEFSNIILAATGPGIGFAAAPAMLTMQQLSGKNVQVSWTGTGTLQEAATINGSWTDAANQANPQTLPATNSALYFRISQ